MTRRDVDAAGVARPRRREVDPTGWTCSTRRQIDTAGETITRRCKADATAATCSKRRERGSVLLVVMLLASASVAVSAALIDRARLAGGELRARRDVLCARYAALGGLALGGPTASDGSAAALLSSRASYLVVSRVLLSPSWCVLRSTASCEGATRTYERTLADVSVCVSP